MACHICAHQDLSPLPCVGCGESGGLTQRVVDFNVVRLLIDDCPQFLVNGEVCRWNDYDYTDDDRHRQAAMQMCSDFLDGASPFHCNYSDSRHTALQNVVRELRTDWLWRTDNDGSERSCDFLRASIEIGQNLLSLE